ncbi:hypothetical protein [Legionella waltersii]|uniref:Dot/Icm T4SS effector n=1 Tax=Legionella waltersii TaxID=66969 RepID=A0A0W1A2P5_9GAMM|nr:hypothetical protein [Legionella waltersii]KTD75629.1 hypothetical protein Lwal_2567 [Legionella waltersii]SNU98999.1 Uncharacterised protein [Legionella waltersii]
MFKNISFFGLRQKPAVSFSRPYSDFQLVTDKHVPATDVVWHRVHGQVSEAVFKDGFSGRENLPTDNLKSYIAFNTKFGGFGGTVSIEKAVEFAKSGANNIKNFVYSSVNPNQKISIPAFIREMTDTISESATASKINEMEVMALGDIEPEFVFYATDDLENLARGNEVENLMHRANPKLPATYRSSDVATPASILLHLAKSGCTDIIAEFVQKQLFSVDDLVQLAKQTGSSELSGCLDCIHLGDNFGRLSAN